MLCICFSLCLWTIMLASALGGVTCQIAMRCRRPDTEAGCRLALSQPSVSTACAQSLCKSSQLAFQPLLAASPAQRLDAGPAAPTRSSAHSSAPDHHRAHVHLLTGASMAGLVCGMRGVMPRAPMGRPAGSPHSKQQSRRQSSGSAVASRRSRLDPQLPTASSERPSSSCASTRSSSTSGRSCRWWAKVRGDGVGSGRRELIWQPWQSIECVAMLAVDYSRA